MTNEMMEKNEEKKVGKNKILDNLEWFYKATIICILLMLFGIAVIPYSLIILAVILIGCAVTSIVALYKVKSGKYGLKDNGYIIPAFSVSVGLIFGIGVFAGFAWLDHKIGLSSDFRQREEICGIKSVVRVLSKENSNWLHSVDSWNDLIRKNGELCHYPYFRKDTELERYALNAQALRTDIAIPDDMVLIFPTEGSGKDQIGGVELYRQSGARAICVLLVNGKLKQCPYEKAKYLKWSPQDAGVIPVHDLYLKAGCLAVLLFSVPVAVIVRNRPIVREKKKTIILMAFLAAVAGGFMGWLSENWVYNTQYFHYYGELNLNVGVSLGAIVGLLAGICYTVITAKKVERDSLRYASMFGYITLYGIITGILSAIFVHLLLMVFYEVFLLEAILMGSAFGLYTGLLLAVFTRSAFKARLVADFPGKVLIPEQPQ